jgi:hypothetical protein
MAKVILEFEQIEEWQEIQMALNGHKWFDVSYQLDQWLRSEVKHNTNNTAEQAEAYKKAREKLREMVYEYYLTLDI